MSTPEQAPGLTPVPPYRALRPASEGVTHYIDDGSEFLCIESKQPYGALTEMAFTEPDRFNLLHGLSKDQRGVHFSVPEDSLSLNAVILGAGREGQAQLENVFRSVGRVTSKLVKNGVHLPHLSTSDFLVVRSPYAINLLPPVDMEITDDVGIERARILGRGILDSESTIPANLAIDNAQCAIMEGIEDGWR